MLLALLRPRVQFGRRARRLRNAYLQPRLTMLVAGPLARSQETLRLSDQHETLQSAEQSCSGRSFRLLSEGLGSAWDETPGCT